MNHHQDAGSSLFSAPTQFHDYVGIHTDGGIGLRLSAKSNAACFQNTCFVNKFTKSLRTKLFPPIGFDSLFGRGTLIFRVSAMLF